LIDETIDYLDIPKEMLKSRSRNKK